MQSYRKLPTELEDELELSSSERDDSRTRQRDPSSRKSYILFFLFQILLILIYTLTSIVYVHYHQNECLRSPNNLSGLDIRYEKRLLTAFQNSPYTGTPSPEKDKAWHDLMSNMTIRVTGEELKRGNQTSVELPNGGHMAWLGVYHELHCAKFIREWKYKEYYFPDINEEDTKHKSVHADHCIEMLRESALCHADTSLTTFKWTTHEKPVLDLKRPLHSCVNWNALSNSVWGRVVGEEEALRTRKSQILNPN